MKDEPLTLRIVSKSPGHVVAAFRPILIAAFTRPPSDGELREIEGLASSALDEGLRGSLLYVVARRDMTGGVDPRVRSFFTDLIAKNQGRAGPTAVVVLADGFAGALVRGAVTGLIRLMTGRGQIRVFSSVGDACHWLATEQHIAGTALVAAWREAAAGLAL
ncbi:MAG: hypothetical protein U0234_29270 [Sandaracinus sp.]